MTTNPTDDPAPDSELRDRIFHIVLTAQQAEQNHGNTVTIAEWARDEIMPVIELVSKQARFWADHFHEVEKANRDALGAHHKPGYTVAELITALVGNVARLTRQRDEAQGALMAINDTLGLPAEALDDPARIGRALREALASRPAIPADAERQMYEALGDVPTHRADDGKRMGSIQRIRALAEKAVEVARSWSALVSGSDTTEEFREPRTWSAGDPEPPADVQHVRAANSQVFTRRTFWQPGIGALLHWSDVADRAGQLTEFRPSVSSGGDTDTMNVPSRSRPTVEHWITEDGHRLREHEGKLWYWGHPDASGSMDWYEDAFPDLDAVRRQGHALTLVPASSVGDTTEDGGQP